MKLAMYLEKSHENRGIVREKYDLGLYLEKDRIHILKVTLYLHGCLASKRCSASALMCRYLNPAIKLKFIELAIEIYQECCNIKKINCRIPLDH